MSDRFTLPGGLVAIGVLACAFGVYQESTLLNMIGGALVVIGTIAVAVLAVTAGSAPARLRDRNNGDGSDDDAGDFTLGLFIPPDKEDGGDASDGGD